MNLGPVRGSTEFYPWATIEVPWSYSEFLAPSPLSLTMSGEGHYKQPGCELGDLATFLSVRSWGLILEDMHLPIQGLSQLCFTELSGS